MNVLSFSTIAVLEVLIMELHPKHHVLENYMESTPHTNICTYMYETNKK